MKSWLDDVKFYLFDIGKGWFNVIFSSNKLPGTREISVWPSPHLSGPLLLTQTFAGSLTHWGPLWDSSGGTPTSLIRGPRSAFHVFSSVMVSFCSARERSMQTDLIFVREYVSHGTTINAWIHTVWLMLTLRNSRETGRKREEMCLWASACDKFPFIKLKGEYIKKWLINPQITASMRSSLFTTLLSVSD